MSWRTTPIYQAHCFYCSDEGTGGDCCYGEVGGLDSAWNLLLFQGNINPVQLSEAHSSRKSSSRPSCNSGKFSFPCVYGALLWCGRFFFLSAVLWVVFCTWQISSVWIFCAKTLQMVKFLPTQWHLKDMSRFNSFLKVSEYNSCVYYGMHMLKIFSLCTE